LLGRFSWKSPKGLRPMLEFFSYYDTQRFVRLKSWKLSLFWWALLLAVLLLGVSKIIVNKSYRRHDKLHAHVNVVTRVNGKYSDHVAYETLTKAAVVTAVKDKRNASNVVEREVSTPVRFKMYAALHDSANEYHLNAKHVVGRLLSVNGTELKTFEKGHAIKLTFEEMLEAANVRLDETSDLERGKTLRETGTVLAVDITFTDRLPYPEGLWGMHTGPMRYELRVERVEDSQFKLVDGQLTRYCTLVTVHTSGEKTSFAGWGSILSDFGAALGLLSVTTLIVDYTALLVFRERHRFQEFKYEEHTLKPPGKQD